MADVVLRMSKIKKSYANDHEAGFTRYFSDSGDLCALLGITPSLWRAYHPWTELGNFYAFILPVEKI
jgi:hypothetical protein